MQHGLLYGWHLHHSQWVMSDGQTEHMTSVLEDMLQHDVTPKYSDELLPAAEWAVITCKYTGYTILSQ